MKRILVPVMVLVVVALVERGAAAGEKCVSIKKKTKIYATASTDTPVGVATKKVVGFVEGTEGAWHVVRFEQLVEVESGWTRNVRVGVHVRKRDARKARCPDGPTVFMMMPEGTGTDLYWPDGTRAGWSYSPLSGKALNGSTEEVSAGDKNLRCIDYTAIRSLRLRVCADLSAQLGDLVDLRE